MLGNAVVLNKQSNDGCSYGQRIQDASSSTANTVIGDTAIVSNETLRRNLQQHIPRSNKVQFRCEEGTIQPKALAEARTSMRGEKQSTSLKTPVGRVDLKPSDANFIVNSRSTQKWLLDAKRA